MTLIHSIQLVLVSLAQLEKLFVPIRVEFLILLDMCLFTFFALLLMRERHFFHLTLEVLLLELSHPVLGHFCLDVATFGLTLYPELLGILDEFSDVLRVDFLVLGGLGRVFYLLRSVHIL